MGKAYENIKALSWRVKRILKQNKGKEEKVLFCIVGNLKQSLVALSDRCLVIKVGFMAGATFGHRVTSFLYSNITGVEVNTGLFNAVIEICTPSYQGTGEKDWWSMARGRDPFKISNCIPITKSDLKKYQPYLEILRQKIRDAHQPVTTSQQHASTDTNLSAELEKLAELHTKGLLTADEFKQGKAKLLAR